MYAVGTRVNHNGHGVGTIVGYNGQRANAYAENNLGSGVVAAAVSAGLGEVIVNSFYSGDRYPYVIKYDTGYEDVYDVDGQCVTVV